MPIGIYDHEPSEAEGVQAIRLPSDIGPSFVDLQLNYRVMARVTRWHDELLDRLEHLLPDG